MPCQCNKFTFEEKPDVFQMFQGGGGAVKSVNGKTGAVVLDAGDIGYDAETTYPDESVGKELTTINSALSSLQSVTEIIDTASGAIASFPDGSGLPMRSLVAEINPQQDLHGYDAPWAGGSGKNLLDATQNEEGGIDASGVEVAGNTFRRSSNYIPIKANTSYALWANNIWTVRLYWYDANQTFISPRVSGSQGGKAIGVSPSNAVYARWSVYYANNAMTYEEVASSQLQLEEGTDATEWSPYSNICPITGWTGLSGKRCGVNLWDEDWEVGAISTSTGQNTSSTTRIRSKNYIPVDPEKTFWFVGTGYNAEVLFYDKYKNFISKRSPDVPTAGGLLNQPSNCYFVRFTMYSGYGTTYRNDIGINCPSTDTSYHAYTSLPITCTWQSEAGTVYGGTVDVVSGLLTVDTAVETENGGNPYWQLNTGGVGRFYLPSLPSGLDTSRKAESICNVLTYKDDNTVYGSFFVYGGSGLYVNKISASETLEQFKTRISNPALQIIYPLATPQTYQLTPQQISTLLGNNTVFVDCGSVSVTYQASIKGYIDKVLGA